MLLTFEEPIGSGRLDCLCWPSRWGSPWRPRC